MAENGTLRVPEMPTESGDSAGAVLRAATDDVEGWARANKNAQFFVARVGEEALLLGCLENGAVVTVSVYLHEEGARIELCARLMGVDVRAMPPDEQRHVALWMLNDNAKRKRGAWTLPGESPEIVVPVLRRRVAPGSAALEPFAAVRAELDLAFQTLAAAVLTAESELPRALSGEVDPFAHASRPGGPAPAMPAVLRDLLLGSDEPDDGFAYVFDWPHRIGRTQQRIQRPLDRRPEALARFGAGLRHGQRLRPKERCGPGMTVLGVGPSGPDDRPSLYLLPDGWEGGGVLRTGRYDHWLELAPTDEPDVVLP